MKSLLERLLKLASVDLTIFNNSEARDRKLILSLAIFIPISSCLAGYATFTAVNFIFSNYLVAVIVGIAAAVIMLLHDQSLLATEKSGQVQLKIVLSILLALIFTLTNTANKDHQELRQELVQQTDTYNADLELAMHTELNEIEIEEQIIRKRIEEAGKIYSTNRQPLYDARRSLNAFLANKSTRMEQISGAYQKKFIEYDISEMDILLLQSSKLTR